MSHMHELGLGTSLCSHETDSFVVQPYEPIPLIVLPYRLLVCSKTSKSHTWTLARTQSPYYGLFAPYYFCGSKFSTTSHHIGQTKSISRASTTSNKQRLSRFFSFSFLDFKRALSTSNMLPHLLTIPKFKFTRYILWAF